MSQILTRSERRAAERAKEKHIAKLKREGFSSFREITNEPRTKQIMSQLTNKPDRVFLNGLFIVQLYKVETSYGVVDKLMIRRNDASPEHDWAMFQRIKNEICGPERVGVEVYPAESNKVDVANMYWLWVFPEGFDFPLEAKRGT